MIELIYISHAAKRFKSNELKKMLTQFRKKNETLNITGLFLYDGRGTFIQALEGERDEVHNLFNKISEDARHSRVNILGDRAITHRSFSQWAMGFKHLEDPSIENVKGYSNFLEEAERSNYLLKNPSFAVELLEYFKSNNSIKKVLR